MCCFDHDASQQGVGSGCSPERTPCEPRFCENTPNERVAAPTICWARMSGTCPLAMVASLPHCRGDENQMGD
mgnify:CR=1 FL=1